MAHTPYTTEFYRAQTEGSLASARVLLAALREGYPFKSVLDVGCGTGAWLKAAEELGVDDILGVDGNYVDRQTLHIPEAAFRTGDIARPIDLHRRFDLVMCLEAAEHVPHAVADTLLDSLTRHGDVVLFSGAVPYQGGTGHVNENWMEYWTVRFGARGLEPIDFLRWRFWNDNRIDWWYRQNLILYARPEARNRIAVPHALDAPCSAVHPELYLRALRRPGAKRLVTTQNDDLAYWRRVSRFKPDLRAIPPGYGPEFSDGGKEGIDAASYAELKQMNPATLAPVLADAIAPRRENEETLPPLARAKNAPRFIGLGVQKAATTWLARVLRTDRRVYIPPGKEMNFFNRRAFAPLSAYSGFGLASRMVELLKRSLATGMEDPKWLRLHTHIMNPQYDGRWYDTIFRGASGRIAGEITPEYAMLPERAFRDMLTVNPDIKIVLLLRHPVERAISHLGMIADQVSGAERFVAALASEPSLLDRGRYETIVPTIQKVFPPNQLLIGFVDDIARDPRALIARISALLDTELNVAAADLGTTVYSRGSALPVSPDVLDALGTAYGETVRFMAETFPSECGAWRQHRRAIFRAGAISRE